MISSQRRSQDARGRVSRGFTLIELLAGVTISSIALTATYITISAFIKNSSSSVHSKERAGRVRGVLELIEREANSAIGGGGVIIYPPEISDDGSQNPIPEVWESSSPCRNVAILRRNWNTSPETFDFVYWQTLCLDGPNLTPDYTPALPGVRCKNPMLYRAIERNRQYGSAAPFTPTMAEQFPGMAVCVTANPTNPPNAAAQLLWLKIDIGSVTTPPGNDAWAIPLPGTAVFKQSRTIELQRPDGRVEFTR